MTLESLRSLNICPDIVFHCASGSSVPASFESPYSDFRKTVDSTYAVINYILECCPSTSLVMPSSAAVYGASNGTPLSITSSSSPRITLWLTQEVQRGFAYILFQIFRNQLFYCSVFFSVYGPGLRKQLLWDASLKFRANCFEFYGTGNEIRDWIYIDDAINLLYASCKAASSNCFFICNGASGVPTTTRSILTLLAQAYGKQPEFIFFEFSCW